MIARRVILVVVFSHSTRKEKDHGANKNIIHISLLMFPFSLPIAIVRILFNSSYITLNTWV